jgi:hypothetical protein
MKTVTEVAKAHARYLSYEVHGGGADGCNPPPGDIADVGPVTRVPLVVSKRTERHKPIYETLWVDVERRAGRFHPKAAGIADNNGCG